MTSPALYKTPTQAATGLVRALSARDFSAIQACLDEAVQFRALIPPGFVEHATAAGAGGQFAVWFGDADHDFEVAESAVAQFGTKAYARWLVRMWPVGRLDQARRAEQHVYITGSERITRIDLVCSGFQPENA